MEKDTGADENAFNYDSPPEMPVTLDIVPPTPSAVVDLTNTLGAFSGLNIADSFSERNSGAATPESTRKNSGNSLHLSENLSPEVPPVVGDPIGDASATQPPPFTCPFPDVDDDVPELDAFSGPPPLSDLDVPATDKYSSLYDIGPASSSLGVSAEPAVVWEKSLRAILDLLTSAAEYFQNLAGNADSLAEVEASQEGSDYLTNLREVYRIYLRVVRSYETDSPSRLEMAHLCGDVERAWARLTALAATLRPVTLSPADGEENLPEDVPAVGAEGCRRCGLCLGNLLLKPSELEMDMNNATLSHGASVYHSACANFWSNCVEAKLPDLEDTQ